MLSSRAGFEHVAIIQLRLDRAAPLTDPRAVSGSEQAAAVTSFLYVTSLRTIIIL